MHSASAGLRNLFFFFFLFFALRGCMHAHGCEYLCKCVFSQPSGLRLPLKSNPDLCYDASPRGCVRRQHFKGFVSCAECAGCIIKKKLSEQPHVHADIPPPLPPSREPERCLR